MTMNARRLLLPFRIRHAPAGLPRDQRGAAVVEFALVAPVLLILIMGIMDTGFQLYTRSILAGEMQKAGRDSTLETGSSDATTIDARVRAAVQNIAPGATVQFTRKSYRTFSDAAAAQAESYTDTDGDGTCDHGEPFEDANNNGTWDQDGGQTGQGGAKDAVVYTAVVNYPRLFPIMELVGVPATVTMTATTVLRNQPYSDQDLSAPTTGNCP